MARAKLPSFPKLASRVISRLDADISNEDCREFLQSLESQNKSGRTVSVDHLFSSLENDFYHREIQRNVALELKPPMNVDLTAHHTILRLARGPNNRIQLVTTNFDRLFEHDRNGLATYEPPRLPSLSRGEALNGIVYLHGRVNDDYTGANGTEFVLSSADFGHSYLSDGWATEFVRELVRSFSVVFIGYSADDPPVHYLLEGLRRRRDRAFPIYAFQANDSPNAISRWKEKATVIPLSPTHDYCALWDTLHEWARRADDSLSWRDDILQRARSGPRQMKPPERGQVAHIVATDDGARAFAETKSPAEWLCVFDATCRFEPAGREDWTKVDSEYIDPHSLYGLDSDVLLRDAATCGTKNRGSHSPAWDAFVLNDRDVRNLSPRNLSTVRTRPFNGFPSVPDRLLRLGAWLGSVAHEPAALWWAARQDWLHPDYRKSIERSLFSDATQLNCPIRRAWRHVFDVWDNVTRDINEQWYASQHEFVARVGRVKPRSVLPN